jgi:hypothetical protein
MPGQAPALPVSAAQQLKSKSAPSSARSTADQAAARSKARAESPLGVQRAAAPGAGPVATHPAEVKSQLGAGAPLPREQSSRFGKAYRHDLSGVRVHPNSAVASSIGARAFTVGRDVAFAPGEYRPGTPDGDRLIGHELAHVVQQAGGVGAPSVQAAGLGHDSFEAEADRASEIATSGGSVRAIRPVHGAQIQHAPPKGDKPKPEPKAAAGEVDISSGMFEPSAEVADALGKGGEVDLKLPGLAEGRVSVRRDGEHWTSVSAYAITLHHPALQKVSDVDTVLVVEIKKNVVSGGVWVGKPGRASVPKGAATFLSALGKAADALGWLGLTSIQFPTATNTFDNGQIALSVENVTFKLGGFLSGSASVALSNETLTLEGSSQVQIGGLADGALNIKKDVKTGELAGDVSINVTLASFSGNVTAKLESGFVTVQGTVGYTGDKLSGSVTLLAADESIAKNITKMDPVAGQIPELGPEAQKNSKPGKRALCGFGELTFNITEWLAGKVQVIVNSKGQVTVKGEIAPPAQIVLFDQKEWVKNLFKVEIRASYGIPVVGNVFVFANIGLDALAKIGPGVIKDIKLQGQYSTDPEVEKSISLEGTLNISAFAGLRLRAEGGVGITILGHDIKAGVGVWALAGVRGYVEATPIIGYRDKGKGSKGEFYIKGSMEIAGQLILGLGGDLFVEVVTPWWSPLSDKRWTWPLGQIEYPLGEFGIGASVDYVFGSKKWPEINFSEAKFDSDKFLTDVMNDSAPKGGGTKDENKKGAWNEGGDGKSKAGKDADKGKGGGKGKDDKKSGGGFTGPIGEKVGFSDGKESHTLWIAEKGHDAEPMAASTPEKVEAKIKGWEKDIEFADPVDQGKAKGHAAKARGELSKLGTEVKQLAAIKEATKDAKGYYETKGKDSKKAGGNKPDPGKVQSSVKSDEHKVASSLEQLARLTLMVPFEPISHPAPTEGGSEPVRIVEKGGTAQLKVANGDGAAKLAAAGAGPVAAATNKRGSTLLKNSTEKVVKVAAVVAKAKIQKNRINAKVLKSLKKRAEEAAKTVSQTCQTMKIAKLMRAEREERIKKQTTISFIAKPKGPQGTKLYRERFLNEMKRQLSMQQRGLSKLNVDKWMKNLLLFSMNVQIFRELDQAGRREVLDELKKRATDARDRTRRRAELVTKWVEEKKSDVTSHDKTLKELKADLTRAEQRLEQVRRAMAAVQRGRRTNDEDGVAIPRRDTLAPFDPRTLDDDYPKRERLRILGRMENEKSARKKAEDALEDLRKSVKEWRTLAKTGSDLAILHNPDQVAGGYDEWSAMPKVPDDPTDAKAWEKYLSGLKKFFGPKNVNERIGTQWSAKIKEVALPAVRAEVPPEAYAINRLNFKLKPES